jgi:hypothetical protein
MFMFKKKAKAVFVDTQKETTMSLLGREEAAVISIIGKDPDERVVSDDGCVLYRYSDGDIRTITFGSNGRVIKCGYTDERRARCRVFPAHFVKVKVMIGDDVAYNGMAIDMSVSSMKIRGDEQPAFLPGVAVTLDFHIQEGQATYDLSVPATTRKVQRHGDVYHTVFTFDLDQEKAKHYLRYVNCRETEAVYGVKWCVKAGGKCSNGEWPEDTN